MKEETVEDLKSQICTLQNRLYTKLDAEAEQEVLASLGKFYLKRKHDDSIDYIYVHKARHIATSKLMIDSFTVVPRPSQYRLALCCNRWVEVSADRLVGYTECSKEIFIDAWQEATAEEYNRYRLYGTT
jgi:hypothetical protein